MNEETMTLLEAWNALPVNKQRQLSSQFNIKTHGITHEELASDLENKLPASYKAIMLAGPVPQAEVAEPVEEVEMQEHVVTEEDMKNNPELAVLGVEVGDTVKFPTQTEEGLDPDPVNTDDTVVEADEVEVAEVADAVEVAEEKTEESVEPEADTAETLPEPKNVSVEKPKTKSNKNKGRGKNK